MKNMQNIPNCACLSCNRLFVGVWDLFCPSCRNQKYQTLSSTHTQGVITLSYPQVLLNNSLSVGEYLN